MNKRDPSTLVEFPNRKHKGKPALAERLAMLPTSPERPLIIMLDRNEVAACVGLGLSTIYELMRNGSELHDDTFPKPVELTAGGAKRWVLDEVQTWLSTRISRCRQRPKPRKPIDPKETIRQ